MKKLILLFLVMLLVGLMNCTTIIVDIEGTGDYLTIQAGIDASTDGDTVLVYTGRYYENTDLNGKTITLASLEIITGNMDYINTTIIDGNQTGCCVAVHNGEVAGTSLRGITLINGIGFLNNQGWRNGGGVNVLDSSISIINCIIENNSVTGGGGGINILNGNLYLEGTKIRNNYASMYGGGIYSGCMTSTLEYSYNNRCSIYDNFSPLGKDIYNSLETGVSINVIVDTFTVSDPFGYEFYQGDGSYNQNYDDSVFEMQHARYERMDADLYVSPEGNNNNSGLSVDEPLQTIDRAMQIISSDAENHRVIHISDGIYSPSLNNQQFPICMRSYVSLLGESIENTIIDLDRSHCGFMLDLFSDLGYELKNLTIRNGYADHHDDSWAMLIYISNNTNSNEPALFQNLSIQNNEYNWITLFDKSNITMKNVKFIENFYQPSAASIRYSGPNSEDIAVLLENCQFTYNLPGLIYISSSDYGDPEDLKIDIVNCEFSDNEFTNNHTPNFTVGLSLFGFGGMDLNIINSTFANNHMYGPSIGSAPIRILFKMDVEIINSIIYNNTSHSVIIQGEDQYPPVVIMHHDIIENGMDGMLTSGEYILNWDDETNWDVDPLFMNEGDYPYSLQQDSPAIDMGTLELPEGIILPEYDLAGNPRIMGNGIDLGAYECNPLSHPVDVDDEMGIAEFEFYPNPVRLHDGRGAVMINYTGKMEEDGYRIGVYNVKGQKVWESQLWRGLEGVRWDCCDANGLKVAAGIYFLRLSRDGEYLSQGKLTVIK